MQNPGVLYQHTIRLQQGSMCRLRAATRSTCAPASTAPEMNLSSNSDVLPCSPSGLPSIATTFTGSNGTTQKHSGANHTCGIAQAGHRLHNRATKKDREVMDLSRQTTGIIALVLGILVLVWPSWSHVIFGILLILIGVALLTGRMKSLF